MQRVNHRQLLDDLFGDQFWDELIDRMVATTRNERSEAERKMDNCLAYLQARAVLPDPNAPLVCNLGPDEAWHVFLLFTDEYLTFCLELCGEYLHHDPAEEAALVNAHTSTAATRRLMTMNGIAFDADLWMDHVTYPRGAKVIPSGLLAL
jgi:hypothetical protein